MKPVTFILLLLIFTQFVSASTTQISFKTVTVPGKRAPKHVLAVWIEDGSGNYVASVAVYGQERRGYLESWSASSRGVVGDAVTGATITQHKEHSVTWNGKDFRGNDVANGTYVLKIEMTSDGERPVASLNFDVADADYVKDYSDQNYYKNINVTYSLSASGIKQTQYSLSDFNAAVFSQKQVLDIQFSSAKSEQGSIKLFNIKGALVKELFSGKILAGENHKVLRLPDMDDGFYIVHLSTGTQRVSQKIFYLK